jgi:hypothetical protein
MTDPELEAFALARIDLIADIDALLNYASERHLLTGQSADESLAIRANLVEPLALAVQDYRRTEGSDMLLKRSAVLFYYSALAKLTAPVTGQSARCSIGRKAYKSWTVYVTFVMLGLAVLLETVSLTVTDKSWLDFARPLAWGALGSCIFLLKSISDKAADFEFDERLLKGFATRVTIGGVLGMVVVTLFSVTYKESSLSPSAVAFLCGIGAKVIYGALENIIEALAERLTYSAFKRADQQAKPTTEAVETLPVSPTTRSVSDTATKPAPAIDDSQPFSALIAVKNELLARGYNPGRVDGALNPTTVAAIQAFLTKAAGMAATEDQAKTIDSGRLLKWLRAGAVPDGWAQEIGKTDPTADAENAANREILTLLGRLKIGTGAPTEADGQALETMVAEGVTALTARKPELASLSLTDILTWLRKQ